MLQTGADGIGKLGMVVLYAVMAREAGVGAFGDFTSAASLSVLIMVAAFGMDFRVTRLVTRGEGGVAEAYWSALALKLVFGLIAFGGVMAAAVLGPYSDTVVIATALLGVAIVIELQMLTPHAVFRGLEHLQPVATALVLYRGTLAVAGIALLLAGGAVETVAGVWLVTCALAFAYSLWRLRREGIRYPVRVTRASVRAVAADSIGLGIAGVFGAVLSRIDVVILGFLEDSRAVALYGGAYRLVESMQFLTAAIALASFPALARLDRTTVPTVGEASTLALKVMLIVTAPISVMLTVYAEPILEAIYGRDFGQGASILTLLGAIVTVAAVCSFFGYLLTSQRRQRPIVIALGAATVTNIAANFALIPAHGADGAAVAMILTMAVMTAFYLPPVIRTTGTLSLLRMVASPGVATVAMIAVALAIGQNGFSLLASLAAFAVSLAVVERLLYPVDARRIVDALRRRPAL